MGVIGIPLLFICVFGGFVISGGTFGIFLHPGEYIVIIGASIAGMVTATPVKYLKQIITYGLKAAVLKDHGKKDFMEGLQLLYEIFQAQKRDGVQALEAHIEEPKTSKIFERYPHILKNPTALAFITDSIRTFVSGGPSPYDMDDLLLADLEVSHTEEHVIAEEIQRTADGFPAVGIVAAVLGIIITMGSIAAGPEVVGEKVAGALVGTFLGIFCGYGFIGPMAKRIEHHFKAEGAFYNMLKAGILANCRGLPPQISIEFARRSIPPSERPTFQELEELLKSTAAAAVKKAA